MNLSRSGSRLDVLAPQPLDQLAQKILRTFNGRESDANWEQLEALYRAVTLSVPASSSNSSAVSSFWKTVGDVTIASCLQSERTRLASTVMDAIKAFAACRLEAPFWDQIILGLLKVAERANRVFVARAKATLSALIPACPRLLLSRLIEAATGSMNKGLRLVAMELIAEVAAVVGDDLVDDSLRKCLSDGLADASGQVRDAARAVIKVLMERKPHLARDLIGAQQPPIARPPSVSSVSRASSTVVKAPRIVSNSKAASTILGPQRVINSVAVPHADSGENGPKRALRVASSLLANSVSTHNVGGSSNTLASSKPATPKMPRHDSVLQRSVMSSSRMVSTPSRLASSPSRASPAASAASRPFVDWLRVGHKNPDWSARVQAVEALTALSCTADADATKAWQSAITACSDAHPKVQLAAISMARAVSVRRVGDELTEALLVRLVAMRRPEALDVARSFATAPSLLAAMGRPELVKLRPILCQLLSVHSEESVFAEQSLGARLAPLLDDASCLDAAVACFVRMYRANAASYYVAVNQHVRSQPARDRLRQAVASLPQKEADEEDPMQVCITPMRPIRTTASSKLLTPVQASVKKRIESAVKAAMHVQSRSSSMADSPLFPRDGNQLSVDVLVERVKERIRAALTSVLPSTPRAAVLEQIRSSPRDRNVVVEAAIEHILSDAASADAVVHSIRAGTPPQVSLSSSVEDEIMRATPPGQMARPSVMDEEVFLRSGPVGTPPQNTAVARLPVEGLARRFQGMSSPSATK